MSTKPLTAVAPESSFSVEMFAQDLLNDFFIDDENSLVGKLTKLPATGNRQAVCQWLLQLWPWLSYREPTETERRQLINDFGNTVRFIFL